ncbi:MAG: alpha-glycosidase [Lachnospiraceae bacterium]|nr:alpha-glycosidase [Lachnospiraceae bacterium]
MNEHGILHMPDSKYCFPLNANSLVLRLRIDKNDSVDKIEVIHECKYKIQEKQQVTIMEKKYEDHLFSYYEVSLPLTDVRLAYVFRIWEKGKGYYYSEDGLSENYNFSLGYYNFFQLPYINEADVHQEVDWMKEAVFYEIFVDRFYCDEEKKKKDYINLNWGEKPNPKSFAGGDIPGIIEKLDYINALGANALYLTPVFQSISNHKYDISDYHMIDERFGTKEHFKNLVDEAHKRGIRVVLDAVFNHCSELLPQFQDVLENGSKSPYFDWFIIKGEKPEKAILNYEVFAFCEYMPKFNTSNPNVQEFLLDIAVSWIEKYDIDGWRLDVSDEVSHDFWRMFRKKVKAVKRECVIIGENWHDANSFLQGDQYDGIMNYAFTKACLDYYAFEVFDAREFAWKLNHLLMRNTSQVNTMMLNLLDSHDTDRFYTSVNKNKDRMLSAAAVMCMFIGAPCIYYGTEILLEGGYDPDNRRCFDWDESHWDTEFYGMLTNLLGLRKKDVVQNGAINITERDGMLVLSRSLKGEKLVLFTNQSGKTIEIKEEGEILFSNSFQAALDVKEDFIFGSLRTDGFVIIKK